MRRLEQAASPLIALLALVGLVLLGEVGFLLVASDAHPAAIAAEARLAVQRMNLLAWGLGAPLSVVAWLTYNKKPSPRRIPRAPVVGFAGLATAAWMVALAWPVRASKSDRPDVLLIVVDTLRADYVSPDRTPKILRLAREGIQFVDAQTSAPWTLPSFGTILTGRHPRDHGVGVDGARGSPRGTLRPGVRTLAEQFRDAGYQTVSLTTNPHLRRESGIQRGFEFYRNLMRDDTLFFVTFPIGITSRFSPAPVQTSRALTWFGLRDPERPLFMMLHYMDPHLPRDPDDDLVALEKRRDGVTEAEAIYGATVRIADRSIGDLLQALEDSGHLDRMLVILTNDHGEGLEKGKERWDHGNSLYPELVRAPLFYRLPNGEGAGTRCEGLATHLDLGATILEVAGLPPDLGLGRPALGRDGACLPARRTVFQSMASKGPTRDALVTREIGLIWSRPDTWEAFDRAADPEYRIPLPETPEELVQALRRHIDEETRRTAGTEKAPPSELSPETIEQLKALGYME